ncbi:extracellular solute-binding protein [Paenibacillus eucommiae]|uniref:Aldouronate transport system substrate-binding protein n=1 Tax=Paenibacillus eucommiae TaxID=1355755 RepID=A0ABS4J0T9_9BACL|nr:extracellular solute-binding protein [Paenibacillus eucommiae]MBP1993418.1 putative aldouronate transport system substrate-binding protein [Paenibacillus eucommiae]
MKHGLVRKSHLVFIAAALLLCVMLTSCSKSENNETGSPTPANITTGEATQTPGKKEDISVSVYDRGNIPAEEGNATKNRWTDWINEKGPANVKFVPIPRWEEEQKFNTLFASGGAPDLIFTWNPTIQNSLFAQKQLMPLDELIETYSTDYKQLLTKYPALKKMGMKSDGKTYGFGMVVPFDIESILFVRADWLKKLQLEAPTTTEELFNTLKAFVEQDPDGNNKKDTFGINLSFVGGQVIDNMFGVGGYYSVTPDGQYVRNWEREAAMAAFKKRLYDEKLVDKDFLTDKSGEKAQQDFVNGKLGMYAVNGGASATGFKVYEALKTNNPNAEVIAIPLPKSEFGQFSPIVSAPLYNTAVVNAQAKHPEAVMQYVDFLVRESTAKTLKYGLEGIHYNVGANGCPQSIDSDKSTKELSWTADLRMLSFDILEGECADYVTTLDVKKPLEQEYADIVQSARTSYLSPERPIHYDIDLNSMPSLPQDLQLARSSGLEAVFDTYAKAVVGGASYTAEQAAEDAKTAWNRAGGKQLDEFYAKWFSENKDSIVYTKDYYSMKF